MRSIKATKRFLLTKKWIDADICKLILLFIGALIALFFLKYLSSPPEKRTVEEREYSECKYSESNPSICVEIISTKLAVAGDNDNEAGKTYQTNSFAKQLQSNEFIKDRRDVAAQEGMWRATNFVAVATLGQLILGLLGLGLIYGTLIETRKVLIETKNATEAAKSTLNNERETRSLELQPYIKLLDVGFPRADPNWGGGTTQLSITICNTGSTAARKFRSAIVHRDERTNRFGGFGETRGGKYYFFNVKTAVGGEENISSDLVLADFLTPSDEITMNIPIDYSCKNADDYIHCGYLDVGPPARHEVTQCNIIFSVDFNNTFPEGLIRRVFFYVSYYRGYGNDKPKVQYRIINDQILKA